MVFATLAPQAVFLLSHGELINAQTTRLTILKTLLPVQIVIKTRRPDLPGLLTT
jgi:hypothetical protein